MRLGEGVREGCGEEVKEDGEGEGGFHGGGGGGGGCV